MKKKWTFVFFCFVLIMGLVVVSYAYWKVDLFQTDSNIASSSCFQLSFEEQNEEIQLQEVYPLTDSEGKKLQPYTFTVTNTCSNLASYQVNLENILHEYKELPLEYVKVELDNNTPVILTNHKEVEKKLRRSMTKGLSSH